MSKIIKVKDVKWGQSFKLAEPYTEKKFSKETVFQSYGSANDYDDLYITTMYYELDINPIIHSFKAERLVILCDEPTLLPVKLKDKLPKLKKFVLIFSKEHKWQVAERIESELFRTAAEGYIITDATHWCDCPAEPEEE